MFDSAQITPEFDGKHIIYCGIGQKNTYPSTRDKYRSFKGLIDCSLVLWAIASLARSLYKWPLSEIREYPFHKMDDLYNHLIEVKQRREDAANNGEYDEA